MGDYGGDRGKCEFVPFTFVAIATSITHDLLSRGLVAHSVEQRTIRRSWVRFATRPKIFSLPHAVPLTLRGKIIDSLGTTTIS